MAMAVFSFTTSPNLREPDFMSLTKISGTLLEEAKPGRCFVNHFGLQSEAKSTACIQNNIDPHTALFSYLRQLIIA